MPITRILVPLDGTPFAEQALPVATRLARLTGSTLVLAHVEEPVTPPLVGLEAVVVPPLLPDDAIREADAAYLRDVAARLGRAGIEARTVVLVDALAPALRAACEHEGADLVVMASHARVGLARLLLGSAGATITHDGPRVPILVTHGRDDDAAREIGRVVVVLDEEGDAESTVDAAVDLARVAGAAITLVMAHDPNRDRKATLLPTALLAPGQDDADVALSEDVPDETSFLARVAHALAGEGIAVDTRVLDGHDVAATVARHADELRADVVAVGAHGGGGLADKLRHALTIPVLVVPAPEAGGDG